MRKLIALLPAPISTPSRRRRRRAATRSACRPCRQARPPARRLLDGRRLRPRRAQHRQYHDHRRELRLRPVALHARLGRPTSPPPISTMPGSTPSAASPRRSTGTSSSSPAACRWSREAEPLTDALEGFARPLRAGAERRDLCASRPRAARARRRQRLVAALDEGAATSEATARPLLLRLARRPRSGDGL